MITFLKNKIAIFIFLIIISFLVSKNKKQCNFETSKAEVLYNLASFMHASYFTYFYLGSIFFGYYTIHFIIGITNLTTWIYFMNKYGIGCPLTYIENYFCKPKKHIQYRDLLRITLQDIFKINNKYTIYIIVILAIIVLSNDLYNIFY